jgi:hypothetical protein
MAVAMAALMIAHMLISVSLMIRSFGRRLKLISQRSAAIFFGPSFLQSGLSQFLTPGCRGNRK